MKFKLNPLTGEFDYTSESANKQKLNPLTGEFNLVEGDGPFSQIFNPLTGTFNLGVEGGGGVVVEVTGNGYINLTNAVAHHLMELKVYGGTEQNGVPAPDTPVDIICNNGTIKVSPNLFNKNLVPNANEYINRSNGNPATPTSGEFRHSDYITIKENTQYYVGIITSTANSAGLAFYDDTKTYISGISLTELGNSNNIITSPANTRYIRFSFRTDEGYNTNWQNTVYFVEGNQPLSEFIPYGAIYADGTTEKVEVFGKNLFDKNNTLADGMVWRNASSTTSLSGYYGVSPIKVKGGHTYTRSGEHGRINYFLLTDETSYTVEDGSATITVPNDAVSWVFNNKTSTSRDTMMVVEGSSIPTTYEPYYYGGSANAEMLLKVGDYKDTQEVLSGAVTRNVGVLVLDGTEGWSKAPAGGTYREQLIVSDAMSISGRNNIPITHFHYDATSNDEGVGFMSSGRLYLYADVNLTNDQFKQWLADQYANGTPVIVVYPLKTSTTESVAGQPMNIQAGTNIIEITQASIDDLPLYAKYLSNNNS